MNFISNPEILDISILKDIGWKVLVFKK